MPVPTSIADISTTAASNYPAGGEAIGTSLDDYLRTIQSIIKQQDSKGSDIASSTTITAPNAGSYFVVTGTTTIATIADNWNGRQIALKLSGVLQLTHSSGLILPGAANITTAAGDCLLAVNESTGVWRVVAYQRGNGTAIVSGLQASDIGISVQAYDVDTAKTDVAQTFTAPQKTSPLTDNDGSFDLAAKQDFVCTPTGAITLTFTGIAAGQKGEILFTNSTNYAIAKHAAVKCPSTMLATISATGRYRLAYSSLDGTNVDVTASSALS